MSLRALTFSSSSTLSIISIDADSSPDRHATDMDCSPMTGTYFHSESPSTLFSISLYKTKDSIVTKPHRYNEITNNSCNCLTF